MRSFLPAGVGSLFSCLKEENVVSGRVDLIMCRLAVAELLHVLPPCVFLTSNPALFSATFKKKKKKVVE